MLALELFCAHKTCAEIRKWLISIQTNISDALNLCHSYKLYHNQTSELYLHRFANSSQLDPNLLQLSFSSSNQTSDNDVGIHRF